MLIINKENILICVADKETETHWYSSEQDCYYQKTNIGASLCEVPLPDEEWAVPQRCKLENEIWVEIPVKEV